MHILDFPCFNNVKLHIVIVLSFVLAANAWSSTPGTDVGSYGKSPVVRSTVGMTRAHPYAPPTVRGGHF